MAATHTGVDITGEPGNYEVAGLWRVPCMKVPEQAHIIRVTATGEGSTSFEGGRTTKAQKIEHLRPTPFSDDFATKVYNWSRNTVESNNFRLQRAVQRADRQRTWCTAPLAVDLLVSSLATQVAAERQWKIREAATSDGGPRTDKPDPKHRLVPKAVFDEPKALKDKRRP